MNDKIPANISNEKMYIRHRNFFVGLFILLPILGIPAFFIGSLVTSDFFEPSSTLHVRYNTGVGLEKSAAVAILGIKVGLVESVKLNPGGWVDVSMRIKNKYMSMIKKESRALLKQKNLVMGDWSIDLSLGSATSGDVHNGDTLCSGVPIQIDRTLEQVTALVETVGGIVNDLRSGKGTAGKLLHDDSLLTVIYDIAKRVNTIMDQATSTLRGTDAMVSQIADLGSSGTTLVDTVVVLTDRIGLLLCRMDTLITDLHSVTGQMPGMVSDIEKTVYNANVVFRSLESNWIIKRALQKAVKEDTTVRMIK